MFLICIHQLFSYFAQVWDSVCGQTFITSAQYQSTNCLLTGCSGPIDDVSDAQTLISPGYPLKYPNNLQCRQVLTASDNLTLSLTFETLQLAGLYDSLVIKDGPSRSSKVIGSFSRGSDVDLESGECCVNFVNGCGDNGLAMNNIYKVLMAMHTDLTVGYYRDIRSARLMWPLGTFSHCIKSDCL